MTHNFKVIRSVASTKGGFINALETTTTSTVLGVKKTSKHIYNIKTDESVEVGAEFELDLAQFEIKTYQSEYANTDGQMVIGENKWLHEKLA